VPSNCAKLLCSIKIFFQLGKIEVHYQVKTSVPYCGGASAICECGHTTVTQEHYSLVEIFGPTLAKIGKY
jgi:hypothetical protein